MFFLILKFFSFVRGSISLPTFISISTYTPDSKVGAYLTQRLGFSNVGRLQGGIINYTTYWRTETEDTGV